MVARQYSDETRNEADDAERMVLTIPELALRWGLHRSGVYRMIQRGALPAFRVVLDGDWRVRKDVIEAIERGENPASEINHRGARPGQYKGPQALAGE